MEHIQTDTKLKVTQDASSDYKLWSGADTMEWIISIDSSRFEKYRATLKQTFEETNFSTESIVDLDCEDLQQYGIINLEDRKTIYKAIIQLIAKQKKTDSQILDTRIDTTQLLSLSDDEEDEPQRDYNTLLTEGQLEQLSNQGFCEVLRDETENTFLVDLINGFVRNSYEGDGMAQVIINAIVYYHGIRFDTTMYVQIQSGGISPRNYLTSRVNTSLSGRLTMFAEGSSIVQLNDEKKVPPETLGSILTYLSYHKGVEPDPVPCPVRSIHMNQICSDRWDADWIDTFDKKAVFELIIAANYLDIKCLLNLGCAKIATLIKQLDQREINRIIEEEERDRREQAEKEAVESGQQESVFGLTGNDEESGDDENNQDFEESVREVTDNVGIDEGNNDEKQ